MKRCDGEMLIWHRNGALTAECRGEGSDCGFMETMHDAADKKIEYGDMDFVLYGTHVLEMMKAHLEHRESL